MSRRACWFFIYNSFMECLYDNYMKLRRWPNIKPTLFQCVVFAGQYNKDTIMIKTDGGANCCRSPQGMWRCVHTCTLIPLGTVSRPKWIGSTRMQRQPSTKTASGQRPVSAVQLPAWKQWGYDHTNSTSIIAITMTAQSFIDLYQINVFKKQISY